LSVLIVPEPDHSYAGCDYSTQETGAVENHAKTGALLSALLRPVILLLLLGARKSPARHWYSCLLSLFIHAIAKLQSPVGENPILEWGLHNA